MDDFILQFAINKKIDNANNCSIKLNKLDCYLDYINQNRHLINNRPITFQHGDFHIGNTLIDTNGNIVIIDFNRHDLGDPWEEFNRIPFSVRVSEAYASGCIDGYFKNEIPETFFALLALYISVNQISSLPWALKFGESEINFTKDMSNQILYWYDDFKMIIPRWYTTINKII